MNVKELREWLATQRDDAPVLVASDNPETGLVGIDPRRYGSWEMTGVHDDDFIVIEPIAE